MRRMYSKKQIEAIVKYVAQYDLSDLDLHVASINAEGMAITGAGAITGNLAVGGDLDVNGDVRVKTLIESQPNFAIDLPIAESYLTENDFSLISKYFKLVQYGNVIYIVCSISVRNDGESAFTFYWDNLLASYNVELSSTIGEKIYDSEGKKLTEAGTSTITRFASFSGSSAVGFELGHQNQNTLRIRASGSSNIAAGGTQVYNARGFILLV